MKKLFRDRFDKKIAGVCGGLGQFLKIDPTIIRLLVIFLCVITAFLPFLITYLIAALFIPLGPKTYIELHAKKLYRSRTNRKISGICGGLGEMLGIDPTIIRLITIAAMFLTGLLPVMIAYFIGSIIIPEKL